MIRRGTLSIACGLLVAGACASQLGQGSDDGGRGGATGDTGGGGTTGAGGVQTGAGGTGGGGTGGGGTGGGTCSGLGGADAGNDLIDPVETCLLDATHQPVLMSLAAAVTVISFDQVPGPNCGTLSYSSSTASSWRLVVEDASSQVWTIFLRVPTVPPDLVRVGEALDLKLTGGYVSAPFPAATQLIVVSRAGKLVLFGLVGGTMSGAITDGVTLQDADVACDPGGGCRWIADRARITVGGTAALIDPGHAKIVGDLSLAVDRFHRFNPGGGGCDGNNEARMGGYTIPPATTGTP
jgi:hypothetical protein